MAAKFFQNLHLTFQREQSKGLNAVYHFSFTGAESCQGTITIRDKKLDVSDGLNGTADMRITADSETWLKILRGEKNFLANPVMPVHECQGAINSACKSLGITRFTHHDLRHLFATRCIESGVDIPTVSRWLGHKDGGALAMKTYGHLRDQHSAYMAQKVTFSETGPNIAPRPSAESSTPS